MLKNLSLRTLGSLKSVFRHQALPFKAHFSTNPEMQVTKMNIFKEIGEDITETKPIINTLIKDEIWIIDNFFTEKQCKALIAASEKVGYEEAHVTLANNVVVMNKEYRDSKRCMIDDPDLGRHIYNKCKDIMPMACEGGLLDNVNERMRFLKYDQPGANFRPHCDGNFTRSNTERSVITMQIYLNEEMEGGATTFYSDVFPDGKYQCIPKPGRVVFFRQQGWMHGGDKLISGVKYTIRSELMYKWLNKEEIENFQHKKCGVCDETTRFVSLKSCDCPFLVCGCTPYNAYMKDSKFNKDRTFCRQCGEKINSTEVNSLH